MRSVKSQVLQCQLLKPCLMINITPYCKKFNKKPANFLDNPRIQRLIQPDELKITRGRNGATLLHEKHLMEFLLWLHPSVRESLTQGATVQEVLGLLEPRT